MQFSNPLDNIDSGIPGVSGLGLNTNNSGMVNFSTGDPNAGLGTSTVPGTIDLTGNTPNNVTPPTLDANLVNTPVVSPGTGTGTTGNGVISNFPANTNGTVTGTGVNDLNPANLLGFNSTDPSQLISQLDSLFGKGVGQVFYNFLSSGAGYNSNVSTALANANAPYEERSRNNILESFGASGGRYGSPAAIGLGDFESSYALGQQSIFANEYDKSVDRYANMFGGILDTAHLEQANKLGIKDILGGLLSALGGGGAGGNISGIIKTIKDMIQGNGTGFPGTKPGTGPANGDTSGTKTNPTGIPGHQGWIQDSNGLWMSPDQWAAAGFQDPNGNFNWNAFYSWAGEGGSGSGGGSTPVDTSGFTNSDGSINWDNIYGYTGSGSGDSGTGSGGNDYSWLWDTFGFTDPSGDTSGDTGGNG